MHHISTNIMEALFLCFSSIFQHVQVKHNRNPKKNSKSWLHYGLFAVLDMQHIHPLQIFSGFHLASHKNVLTVYTIWWLCHFGWSYMFGLCSQWNNQVNQEIIHFCVFLKTGQWWNKLLLKLARSQLVLSYLIFLSGHVRK